MPGNKPAILIALLLTLASGSALAQSPHGAHGSHSAKATPKAAQGPSSAAYRAANAKMHKAMDIPLTGDADADFVKGMIPHHQGAVDMAKIVLAHGKDPEVRKLAEAIIKSQEEEIAWMKSWIEKRGK